MENVNVLWKEFCLSSDKLINELGRTANIVGEYGEHVAHKYYGGELLRISKSSADIQVKNIKYQVKALKMKSLTSSALGIIRSWDFDYLVVVIFNKHGDILRALEVPVDVAKSDEYATWREYQKGWVITTKQAFLYDKRSRDITESLIKIADK